MGSTNMEVGANPVGLTNEYCTDMKNRPNIRANAALNWEIIKGLKARTEFAIVKSEWNQGKYYDDGSALLLIILLEDINMLS